MLLIIVLCCMFVLFIQRVWKFLIIKGKHLFGISNNLFKSSGIFFFILYLSV